jgi:hypothetical protein
VPKNLSAALNGTAVVQHAALKEMRRLGGPRLQPVRGAEELMAKCVTLRRRSLLPKYDRFSRRMSLQPKAFSSIHRRRQTHARSTALTCIKCNEKPTKSSVADTRYLTEVRTGERGLHEGRFFAYFVTNPHIWQQVLGTSELFLGHTVQELHNFTFCYRNGYTRSS